MIRRVSRSRGIEIIQGDCREHLPNLPDESVQLVLTSPPYNIGKEYESRSELDDYVRLQGEIISECERVLRPGGSICWQLGNHVRRTGEIIPLDLLLYPLFRSIPSLVLRNRIAWVYSLGKHCKKRFSGRYEIVLWFTKGREYTFNLDAVRVPQKYPNKRSYKGPNRGKPSCNPLGKNPGDVWEIPIVGANHAEKTPHPCQFPVALAETLILALSNKGDTVLDPFLGSGTTTAVSVLHERNAIGIELDETYVKIASARVSDAKKGKLAYRERNKPIYAPSDGQRCA